MTMMERTFEENYSENGVKAATKKKKKRDNTKTRDDLEIVDNNNLECVESEFTKKSVQGMSLMESHYETLGSNSPDVVSKTRKFGQRRRRKLLRQKQREKEGTTVQVVQRKRIGNLAPEHDNKVKEMYRESFKLHKTSPSIFIDESGVDASLISISDSKYPLIFLDIEEFIYNAQLKIGRTRWACINRLKKVRNTIILVVEGPGKNDYEAEMDDCPTLKSFRAAVEFISPLSYDDTLERCFASSLEILPPQPVAKDGGTESNKESETQKGDMFTNARDTLFNIKEVKQMKQVDNKSSAGVEDLKRNQPVSNKNDLFAQVASNKTKASLTQTHPVSLYKQDNFSRLDLILTPKEMANERYPLPFFPMFHNFVMTKDEYEPVTEKSPMFGLDCEMCITTAGSELTRISIVNEKHEIVYEKLVKPFNTIINYATKYSGITPKMLRRVTTRLSDVQNDLRDLLPPNAVLVGQSLNFDLIAMKMMHPYVIDTSTIYNVSGVKARKTKLKTLCEEYISEKIQCSSRLGHDSIEDAWASLKLVQEKLKHSIEWGNKLLGYNRTEKESRDAHLLLIEKEKNRTQPRYRLAYNAKVDDPDRFDPYRESLLDLILDGNLSQNINDVTESSNKRKREDQQDVGGHRESEELENKKRKKLDNKVIKNDPSSSKNERSSVDKKTDKDDDKNNSPEILAYPDAYVIGSEELCKRYKSHLPVKYHERVHFIKGSTSNDVVQKAITNNSDEENRVIIVHLDSPCVCKVEKWTKKLFDACKASDMLCVALCGTKNTEKMVSGAFFVTFPFQQSAKPIKQSVQEYLESNGYVYNPELKEYTKL